VSHFGLIIKYPLPCHFVILALLKRKDKIDSYEELEMRFFFFILLAFSGALAGCDGWSVQTVPYNVPPTTLPSHTPLILTPTPKIVPPTGTPSPLASTITPTQTTPTVTPGAETTLTSITSSPTTIPTIVTVPSELIKVDILGCDTGLDIVHGMGEVTNAYITISNASTVDLGNVCATLRGQDEGRPHPDKTKCIPALPAGDQVKLKLTIDTTYKKDSPIQIDITSNDILIHRLAQDSCTGIGLFSPDEDDFGQVKPIP
jgi:hypothetical protein